MNDDKTTQRFPSYAASTASGNLNESKADSFFSQLPQLSSESQSGFSSSTVIDEFILTEICKEVAAVFGGNSYESQNFAEYDDYVMKDGSSNNNQIKSSVMKSHTSSVADIVRKQLADVKSDGAPAIDRFSISLEDPEEQHKVLEYFQKAKEERDRQESKEKKEREDIVRKPLADVKSDGAPAIDRFSISLEDPEEQRKLLEYFQKAKEERDRQESKEKKEREECETKECEERSAKEREERKSRERRERRRKRKEKEEKKGAERKGWKKKAEARQKDQERQEKERKEIHDGGGKEK